MTVEVEKSNILPSQNQLKLFGFNKYFNFFTNLYKKENLPNVMLFNGPKGIGKSTFALHLINYILSLKDEKKYSLKNFEIDSENSTYKKIIDNTHPNYFSLDNYEEDGIIKIENVRNLLNFLNKTTLNSNIKIVLIDNAELLNINSSNALLKSLEEPKNNTFFFIINDSKYKILETIKSRSMEFKFFFSFEKKKKIIHEILEYHNYDFSTDLIDERLYFDTPGNILKYISVLDENNTNTNQDKLSSIYFLIDKYKQKKTQELLNFISLSIEILYNDLSVKNHNNISLYNYKKFKILKEIDNMKKFNLDKNNFFVSLKGYIKNDR
jgi:DNA polymerase III subunit delta'